MKEKYNQIVEFIHKCTNEEELDSARAQVNAYRMQTGGSNPQLKYEIDVLFLEINEKQKEILKMW